MHDKHDVTNVVPCEVEKRERKREQPYTNTYKPATCKCEQGLMSGRVRDCNQTFHRERNETQETRCCRDEDRHVQSSESLQVDVVEMFLYVSDDTNRRTHNTKKEVTQCKIQKKVVEWGVQLMKWILQQESFAFSDYIWKFFLFLRNRIRSSFEIEIE